MRHGKSADQQLTWKRGCGVALTLVICAIWLVTSGILEISWNFGTGSHYSLAGGASRKAGPAKRGWVANTRPKEPICTDTCASAKNGVCDDGRTVVSLDTREVTVKCDLGTDCSDCGPWMGDPLPDAWTETVGPIAYLQRFNYSTYVRRAGLPDPVYIAYTNWDHDVDVSGQMHVNSLVEAGITKIFYHTTREACNRTAHPNDPGLVVDVGGNFGYYSLITASLGCRVVAWEPVPMFRAFFAYATALNNLTSRLQIRARVVGAKDGLNVTMVIPQRGIWGTAGVDGLNIDKAIDNQGDYRRLTLPTERVDSVVTENVVLMKIDVEGYEPDVWEGASKLVEKHEVENILMEYSPGIWQQASKIKEYSRMPGMLVGMKRLGYNILHVHGGVSHDLGWLTTPDSWESPIPAMPEITSAILKYDMMDAAQVENGTLSCFPTWPVPDHNLCRAMPEGYHPKSFKSLFTHNTNIWAFKDRTLGVTNGYASLIDPDDNMTSWTVNRSVGSGGRYCPHMDPVVQVLHRCPCPDESVCGRLEETLNEAVRNGKIPFAS